MRRIEDLRGYQCIGVKMIDDKPGVMLTLEPGLGKTITTLTAAKDLLDTFIVGKVLIIAPLLVAQETWPTEIADWEHTKDLTYSLILGDAREREAAATSDAQIHIVNKENVSWLVAFHGDDWPYDMLVVDESSCFKNPSKTNKPSKKAVEKWALDPENVEKPKKTLTRFGALCKVRSKVSRVVLLTGTPAPNGLLDLWSQYYLIDQGERLLRSFNAYKSRWFDSDYMGYKWTPKAHALRDITERIADVTLSMRASDWITLPGRIDNIIRVHLPEKVMAQYRKFERTLLLEEHDIEAVSSGVLSGKLLQLANGSCYREDGTPVEIHDLKLKALDALIAEANGKPVLVAYSYDFDLTKLRGRYQNSEVLGEAKGQVARWNRGEISVLLTHPASASYGLNLQDGGHITVWYGLPWSLEYYVQLNARLLRSGQKSSSVIIHHIVADATVDDDVLAALSTKGATQEAVIEATLYRKSTSC